MRLHGYTQKLFLSVVCNFSGYPSMNQIKPEIKITMATSAIIRFRQLNMEDSLADYYFYAAHYQVSTSSSNYDHTVRTTLRHNKDANYASINITNLNSKSEYKAWILPYRDIPNDTFKNKKSEPGTPSQEVTFTTRKYKLYFFEIFLLVSNPFNDALIRIYSS